MHETQVGKRLPASKSEARKSYMSFSSKDKFKALAIVNIFETSKPFGDFAACVVLNDGAGVSYGINQFTHRSGSLLAVVNRYLQNGGRRGIAVFEENLALLSTNSTIAIQTLAANEQFKKALRAAAVSSEMKAAQEQIAFERYLQPAIGACEGSNFVLPLSLAVIYDSMTHGSWEKIRDRVKLRSGEKAWITDYVRQRDAWLKSIPRLKVTSYRTKFFMQQIAVGQWYLELPLTVHGIKLTDKIFKVSAVGHFENSAVSTKIQPQSATTTRDLKPPKGGTPNALPTAAQPPIIQNDPTSDEDCLDKIQKKVNKVAAKYDQVENIVETVITRKDAAKSLWTTVAGTLWQIVWAVGTFAVGLPKEVWLVVAVIVAILTLFYLYRQIVLGKLRERVEFTFQRADVGKKEN